jgi:hypothetical protein
MVGFGLTTTSKSIPTQSRLIEDRNVQLDLIEVLFKLGLVDVSDHVFDVYLNGVLLQENTDYTHQSTHVVDIISFNREMQPDDVVDLMFDNSRQRLTGLSGKDIYV